MPLQLLYDFLEKLSEDDHPTPPLRDVDDSQTSSHDANDAQSNVSQDFNDSQSDSTQESCDLEPNSSQNTDNFQAEESCSYVGAAAIAIALSIVKCSLTQLGKIYIFSSASTDIMFWN